MTSSQNSAPAELSFYNRLGSKGLKRNFSFPTSLLICDVHIPGGLHSIEDFVLVLERMAVGGRQKDKVNKKKLQIFVCSG